MRWSIVVIAALRMLSTIGCAANEDPRTDENTLGETSTVSPPRQVAARTPGTTFVQILPPPKTTVVTREEALRLDAEESTRRARQRDPVQALHRLKSAGVVVVARAVAEDRKRASDQGIDTTFEVLASLRGQAQVGSRIHVTQPSDDNGSPRTCAGVDYTAGHDYLLFLGINDRGGLKVLSDPIAGPAAFRRSAAHDFVSANGAIAMNLEQAANN